MRPTSTLALVALAGCAEPLAFDTAAPLDLDRQALLQPPVVADVPGVVTLLSQDWTNTGLLTTNDVWTSVPGIVGYRGDNVTATSGSDPQTLLGEGTITIDVNVGQTAPNTFTTGGVTEFEITNPVVALAGSGTADAPSLVATVATTGLTQIGVSYTDRKSVV